MYVIFSTFCCCVSSLHFVSCLSMLWFVFSAEEIELKFEGEVTRGENVIYGTKPSVFHGNGPSKIFLNYLGNYLGKAWTEEKGCGHCKDDLLEDPKDGSFPKVFVGIFIDQPTPFLAQFFQRFFNISYPKDKITVYLRNSVSSKKCGRSTTLFSFHCSIDLLFEL